MPQFAFNLNQIDQLDGGLVAEVFRRRQEAIVKDCLDRPGEHGKRKITVTFQYEPVSGRGGDSVCDDVKMSVRIKASVPDEQTREYTMSPRQNGGLVAHTDFIDSPNDKSLYDEDGDANADGTKTNP